MVDHAISKLCIHSKEHLASLARPRYHALSFCSVVLYSPGEIRPATKEWGWTLRCETHRCEMGFRTFREACECQRLWPFEMGECWDYWRESALKAIAKGQERVFFEARAAIFAPEPAPELSIQEAMDLLALPGKVIDQFNQAGGSEAQPIYQVGPSARYDPSAKAFCAL